jgi:hypothetical protein
VEEPPKPDQPAIPQGLVLTPINGGFLASWTPEEGVFEYLLSINDGTQIVSTFAYMQPGVPYQLSGTIQDWQDQNKSITITNGKLYQVRLKSATFNQPAKQGLANGGEYFIFSNYSNPACVIPVAYDQAAIVFSEAGETDKIILSLTLKDLNGDGIFDYIQNDYSKFDKAQYHVELNDNKVALGSKVTVSYPDPNDKNIYLLPAFSGQYVLWYGNPETGTISDQASNSSTKPNSGEAISPVIDLTNFSYVTAILSTWFEVESVDVAGGQFDQMEIYVGIFDDNKADGEPITITYGAYEYVLENNAFYKLGTLNPEKEPPGMQYAYINFSSGGINEPPIWVTMEENLSPFAGHKIRFKFKFFTKDSNYNGFRGWALDDLIVQDKKSTVPFVLGQKEQAYNTQLSLIAPPER